MKKVYLSLSVIAMLALVITFASAASYRGDGGNVNINGQDISNAQTSLNYWTGSNAQAGFSASGYSAGSLTRLSANLKQVFSGIYMGSGTYWVQGSAPTKVNFYYVSITPTSIVGYSWEGIDFSIDNMNSKIVG